MTKYVLVDSMTKERFVFFTLRDAERFQDRYVHPERLVSIEESKLMANAEPWLVGLIFILMLVISILLASIMNAGLTGRMAQVCESQGMKYVPTDHTLEGYYACAKVNESGDLQMKYFSEPEVLA